MPETTADPARLDRLHAFLAEQGAECAVRDGRSVALGFGAPAEEHRALRDSVALLDDTDRSIVRVSGERAREMVNGLVTNGVASLEPGRGVYAFLLTPRGRPVADLRVLVRDGETVWLDVPAAAREGTLEHLSKFLPPLYAEHELEPARARLSVAGPEAARAVAAFLAEEGRGDPPDPEALRSLEPLAALAPHGRGAGEGEEDVWPVVRREAIEGDGFDLYLPSSILREAWEELARAVREEGGRPAGRDAFDVWRVEEGLPAYGAEITADVLPQETGQGERALDFEKGCYTGQEVVAKIHYRGKVNRRLAGLRLPADLSGLPRGGDDLYAGERSRGWLTTVVRSPRLGPVALGYVHREVEAGRRLALEPGGEGVAEVAELPLTG